MKLTCHAIIAGIIFDRWERIIFPKINKTLKQLPHTCLSSQGSFQPRKASANYGSFTRQIFLSSQVFFVVIYFQLCSHNSAMITKFLPADELVYLLISFVKNIVRRMFFYFFLLKHPTKSQKYKSWSINGVLHMNASLFTWIRVIVRHVGFTKIDIT